jgi:AcrR family transcriptional regulator
VAAPRRSARGGHKTRGGWAFTGTQEERRASARGAIENKAARTRENLLAAARAVFAKHGYAGANVARIVAEAGVARGSFYTYFESKADVFGQLVATIDRRIAREVVDFGDGRSGDPVRNLAIANRNYLALVGELADLYRLVDEVASHDPSVRAGRLRSRARHIARIEKAILRWQERGVADRRVDARLTASALVAMLSGFAQWIHTGGDACDQEAALAVMNQICVRACGLRAPMTPREERGR